MCGFETVIWNGNLSNSGLIKVLRHQGKKKKEKKERESERYKKRKRKKEGGKERRNVYNVVPQDYFYHRPKFNLSLIPGPWGRKEERAQNNVKQ